MATIFFEEGRLEGLQEGRQVGLQEGLREATKIILEGRFCPLSKRVTKIIETWPDQSLRTLTQTVASLESLTDLKPHPKQKGAK